MSIRVCVGNILVMVNETAEAVLANSTSNSSRDALADALASGFSIEWSADNTNCDYCTGSGGICGYEPSTGLFACYCEDGPYAITCGNAYVNGGTSVFALLVHESAILQTIITSNFISL